MADTENARLAVLIDADNTTGKRATEILAELAKYGTLTVKRAYGDWTSQHLVAWKDQLNRHAIQPVQQFAYTVGKNSTDSALIIDAMDLLYSGNQDGFCIVSSDSDFTRLATRLREAGKTVYGLGRRATPQAFIAACDKFIFLEVLDRVTETAPAPRAEAPPRKRAAKPSAAPSAESAEAVEPPAEPSFPDLKGILTPAIAGTSKESGWSSLSSVGGYIGQNDSSFDSRNYGFARLSDLVRSLPYVEVREVEDSNKFAQLWVRLADGGQQAVKKSSGSRRNAAKKRTQD